MALYPGTFRSQWQSQPGARGDKFNLENFPGYGNEDRVNRTGMRLAMNEHDTVNIKFMLDYKLPVLFRYGFAFGFNQLTIPKGRIVAVDPQMIAKDFDTTKYHPVLTLANGGTPVKIRSTESYPADASNMPISSSAFGKPIANKGKEWTVVGATGSTQGYRAGLLRPFTTNGTVFLDHATMLENAGLTLDPDKGLVHTSGGAVATNARVGNVPAGIIIRNEYTRDEDAFNGMQPGAVNTNAMVELPWFEFMDKAEGNPWGSAYGNLKPGDLVKSDANGRLCKSPLSEPSAMTTMSIAEYECERQQVVGQIYSVSTDLVPEGAAKYAQWALSDRLDFEDFNPQEWSLTNRRGEDFITRSAHQSQGQYPGYPYDSNYGAHDLHMMGGLRENYDRRMSQEYQLQNGIPGLTDGKNVHSQNYGPFTIGKINSTLGAGETIDLYFRLTEVDVESATIKVGGGSKVTIAEGQSAGLTGVTVKFWDKLQGLVVLTVNQTVTNADVVVEFVKKGLAGVPTFMDWDGCKGSLKVLLQK